MKKRIIVLTLIVSVLGGTCFSMFKNVKAASINNQTAFCVGTDYRESALQVTEINSTPAARNGATTYNDMGWETALITMPTRGNMRGEHSNGYAYFESSIVLLAGHGNGSVMTWNYKQNGGNYQVGIRKSPVDYETEGYDLIGIGRYDLEQNDLVILLGCSTATDTISLAKYFVNNGAETSIGWNEDVSNVALGDWLENFNEKLATNSTVQEAVSYANSKIYIDSAVKNNTIFGNANLIPRNKFLLARTLSENENLSNQYVINKKVNVINEFKSEEMMKSEIEKIIKEKINPEFNSANYQVEINGIDEVVYDYILYLDNIRTNLGYSIITRKNKIIYIRDNTNGEDINVLKGQLEESESKIEAIDEKISMITQKAYEMTQSDYDNSTFEIINETLYYDTELGKLCNVTHILVIDNVIGTRYVVEHVEELK